MKLNKTLFRTLICILATLTSIATYTQNYFIMSTHAGLPVCPNTTHTYSIQARTDTAFRWTVSHGRFANGQTTTTTRGFLHYVSVTWDHVSANQNNVMPRGVIQAMMVNGDTAHDFGRDTIVILSVRNMRTNVMFDGRDTNIPVFNFPYGSTESVLVSASRHIFNTNVGHVIFQNQWILPEGLSSFPPRAPNTPFSEETVNVFPASACTSINGRLRVRAENSPCYFNLSGTAYLHGIWRDVEIRRSRPTVTLTTTHQTVPWGQEALIIFTATTPPIYGVQQFVWEVSGNFDRVGRITTTTDTIQLIHRGCFDGSVSVQAVYCWDRKSDPSITITVGVTGTVPSISGPAEVCAEGTFRIANTNLSVTSWNITYNPNNTFTITSETPTSVTVRACPNGQQGTLSATVNGCRIDHTVRACLINQNTLSISGPSLICGPTVFRVGNLPQGAVVNWDSENNLAISNRTGATTTASHRAPHPAGPSSITARVNFPGCPVVPTITLHRPLHIGGPDSRLISSLHNGQRKEISFFNPFFGEVLTYNGRIPTGGALDGITRIEWRHYPQRIYVFPVNDLQPSLSDLSHIEVLMAHFPTLVGGAVMGSHRDLQINRFTTVNNQQVARIQVRMQNQCGWSNWATLTYLGPQVLWPPGDDLIPILGCPCGFIPAGGPRPCPICEITVGPLLPLFSPNPVSDVLTIDLTETDTDAFGAQTDTERSRSEIFDIRLLNSHGMIVRQQRTQASSIQFDVSNLPEGTYYLHIEHNGEIEMHQIIVQRN